jgi:hypothetical protein
MTDISKLHPAFESGVTLKDLHEALYKLEENWTLGEEISDANAIHCSRVMQLRCALPDLIQRLVNPETIWVAWVNSVNGGAVIAAGMDKIALRDRLSDLVRHNNPGFTLEWVETEKELVAKRDSYSSYHVSQLSIVKV